MTPPDTQTILFEDGRLEVLIPAVGQALALHIAQAQIGLQRAGEPLTLCEAWQMHTAQPMMGSDRCGTYTGLHVVFTIDGGLQISWQAFLYTQQPVMALQMSVTNTAVTDAYLERLVPLVADAQLGAHIDAGLHASRALVLGNGLWMDTAPQEWRLPVPEGTWHEAFWSTGVSEREGGALIVGIGEAANTGAGIAVSRVGEALSLTLNGWLWTDLARQHPLRLHPGQSFQMQRMLLSTSAELHAGLIAYADFVKRYLNLQLHFPPYAGIFAAYGGDPAGEHPENYPLTEERIHSMRRVLDDYLLPYGLDTFKTQFAGLSSGPPGMVMRRNEWMHLDVAPAGDDLAERIYQAGFTPDVYDSRADFPHGIEAHVRDLKRRGYRPALVCRPFLNVRSGTAAHDQLAANIFEMAVRRWGYDYLMFDFNSEDYESVDDTHTVQQGIRSRFQAIRDRVGPDIFIEACMVSPGPVLGIADGFRQACDWRGGTEPSLARQACGRYYYHGRWFQLDHEFFDPQLHSFTWVQQGVQGMLASLDRVRLWTSFGGLTGFSWLTGGVVENVSPERWDIFTRALPVLGACAKPVDLLQNDPPRLWVMNTQVAGQSYVVAGIFNWCEQPLAFTLDLHDLLRQAGSATSAQAYLCFDFWAQHMLGPAPTLSLELPPCSCKVLFVHPQVQKPMWLGSDRHVTGAIGLRELAIGADAIEGHCVGPAGSCQRQFFWLPENVAPATSVNASVEVSQYRVIRVGVKLNEQGDATWRVNLQSGQRIL
jgi:hypothetical protein